MKMEIVRIEHGSKNGLRYCRLFSETDIPIYIIVKQNESQTPVDVKLIQQPIEELINAEITKICCDKKIGVIKAKKDGKKLCFTFCPELYSSLFEYTLCIKCPDTIKIKTTINKDILYCIINTSIVSNKIDKYVRFTITTLMGPIDVTITWKNNTHILGEIEGNISDLNGKYLTDLILNEREEVKLFIIKTKNALGDICRKTLTIASTGENGNVKDVNIGVTDCNIFKTYNNS